MILAGTTNKLTSTIDMIQTTGDKKDSHISLSAKLITPDESIDLTDLIGMDIHADYNDSFTDDIRVSCIVDTGTAIKRIYPFKDNLNIEVIETINDKDRLFFYKAIIQNLNQNVDNGLNAEKDAATLERESMIKLEFQCVTIEAIAMSKYRVEGSYIDTKISPLIVGLFKESMKSIKIKGKPINLPVNLSKVNNDRIYDHVMIPLGTKLFDMPTELQLGDYGVYNGHIGTYLTHYRLKPGNTIDEEENVPMVFIYPLYKTNEFNKSKRKLVIVSNTNITTDMIKNTHKDTGEIVYLIASNDIDVTDISESTQLNNGIGIRAKKSHDMMYRNLESKESASISQSKQVNEFALKERDDGLNVSTLTEATDNLYKYRSQLMKDNGRVVVFKWTFSVHRYLFPGMPVKYMYMKDGEIKELTGALQGAHTTIDNDRKMSVSLLNVFLSNNVDDQ